MKPKGAQQPRKPVACDNVQMCPHEKEGAQEHISTITRGAVPYKQLSKQSHIIYQYTWQQMKSYLF